MKQPEQKTLEISVVDFMAREEFVDENGIIPQVLPNYNLGKDDILFSGTVDLSNLSLKQDINNSSIGHSVSLCIYKFDHISCQDLRMSSPLDLCTRHSKIKKKCRKTYLRF